MYRMTVRGKDRLSKVVGFIVDSGYKRGIEFSVQYVSDGSVLVSVDTSYVPEGEERESFVAGLLKLV